MQIQESGEMYLESILVLSEHKDTVRSVDVAKSMQVSKPAVSRAVARLKEKGFLQIDDAGCLSLTESGHVLAEKIYERHVTLTNFLIGLGVGPATASADACKMEHDISDESFEAMKKEAIKKKP